MPDMLKRPFRKERERNAYAGTEESQKKSLFQEKAEDEGRGCTDRS
jgi:hypothetical protein